MTAAPAAAACSAYVATYAACSELLVLCLLSCLVLLVLCGVCSGGGCPPGLLVDPSVVHGGPYAAAASTATAGVFVVVA